MNEHEGDSSNMLSSATWIITLLATLTGSAATLASKAMYQVPLFATKTFSGA